MQADDFLAWLAVQRQGTVSKLKKRIIWASAKLGEPIKDPWTVIRALNQLGYIDLSVEYTEWKSRPATISKIPGDEALALVTGCYDHSRYSDGILQNDLAPTQINAQSKFISSLIPSSLYVEVSDTLSLSNFAHEYSCQFLSMDDAFDRLTENRLVLPELPSVGPRIGEEEIELFSWSIQRYIRTKTLDTEGVYRQNIFGRRRYWIYSRGEWRRVDHWSAIWIGCKYFGENNVVDKLLSYNKHEQTIRFGEFISIPPNLERLMIFSTGMLPRFDNGYKYYDNINESYMLKIIVYLNIR